MILDPCIKTIEYVNRQWEEHLDLNLTVHIFILRLRVKQYYIENYES